MTPSPARHRAGPASRFGCWMVLWLALAFPAAAVAQFTPADANTARSVSGQFLVSREGPLSFLATQPAAFTNITLLRLEPALLAISAERTRENLWQVLGIRLTTQWRGRIYLSLHPAVSPDENVVVLSQMMGGTWNYQVRLPDVVARTRYTRALTGVLLMEYANRKAGTHPAEIPPWLPEGLTQQLLASAGREFALSTPVTATNGLLQNRIVSDQRGADYLAAARDVLRSQPALTFAQLIWPTDDQLAGRDGNVYRASAQLFVAELLRLKNGPAKIRAMLENAPNCYNWQTAFQNAFRENFASSRDVEKWWALQTVNFIARAPGPLWTAEVSRDKLNAILSVPVELRVASNALPVRAEISLQAVIRNWDATQRTAALQARTHDLALAQLRMATPFAALANDYRQALADFLGQKPATASRQVLVKKSSGAPIKASAKKTLQRLDDLDARRRALETQLENGQPAGQPPQNLNVKPPGRST